MKSDMPLVSVITVVYNGEKTISQTIESVINQTYKNIEYIIIDGASTDRTKEIVESYGDRISCFISEKDGGIYDAMNKGILQASGDIIGIINSDDWYDYKAVERAVGFFKKNDVGAVYGDMRIVDKDGKQRERDILPLETIWYQMAIPHPSVFVKKSIYEKFGLFDIKYRLSADYELILRLYSQGVDFGFINEVLAFFREGGLSQIHLNIGAQESREIALKYIVKCWNDKFFIQTAPEKAKELYFYHMACQDNQEYIKNILLGDEPFYIWGTGIWGDRCYQLFKDCGIEIEGFIDSYCPEKELNGYPVIRPCQIPGNKRICIAVKKYKDEIMETLQELDVPLENCLYFGDLEKQISDYGQQIYGLDIWDNDEDNSEKGVGIK